MSGPSVVSCKKQMDREGIKDKKAYHLSQALGHISLSCTLPFTTPQRRIRGTKAIVDRNRLGSSNARAGGCLGIVVLIRRLCQTSWTSWYRNIATAAIGVLCPTTVRRRSCRLSGLLRCAETPSGLLGPPVAPLAPLGTVSLADFASNLFRGYK